MGRIIGYGLKFKSIAALVTNEKFAINQDEEMEGLLYSSHFSHQYQRYYYSYCVVSSSLGS